MILPSGGRMTMHRVITGGNKARICGAGGPLAATLTQINALDAVPVIVFVGRKEGRACG